MKKLLTLFAFAFIALASIFVLPNFAKADPVPAYFNGAAGNNWDDLGSWWQDSAYTVPADVVPVDGDVYIDAAMAIGPSFPITVSNLYVGTVQPNNDAIFPGDLTVTGTATFGSPGVTAFNTYFTGGTLTASNSVFYDSSSNQGTIVGNVDFYEASANAAAGVVNGNANFHESSQNQGNVTGVADFFDNSVNTVTGTVNGTKRYHFSQNTATTQDYAISGPWTLIAENATVSIGGATLDLTPGSPTLTTLQTVGSGSFTFSPPTVQRFDATQQSPISATLNGSITALGGQQVVERGFVYGPTTAYGATTSSSGVFAVGSYSTSISGLSPLITYHFKAFARNNTGTSYSSDNTFTTFPINAPEFVLLGTSTTGALPYGNAVVSTSTVVTVGFGCNCLSVHNVTNKSNPQIIATSSTSGGPSFVVSANNYAYVSTTGGVLETWDIRNPSVPTRVGTYSFPSAYSLGKMRIDNGHLFVNFGRTNSAGPGGTRIFSIANPATTTVLSTALIGNNGDSIGDALPIGNYMYVADYSGAILSVFDISDIANPILRQSITGITEPLDYHAFEPWRLNYKGNALYLADDNVVQIYNISSSTHMVYDSTFLTLKDTEGIEIRGDFFYFSGSGSGSNADRRLQVYDIRDPFHPFVVADLYTGLNNYWISLDSDGYIYNNASSQNRFSVYAPIKPPTVVTSASTNVAGTTLTLNGSITTNNTSSSTDRGFNWGETSSYGNVASTTGLFAPGSFSKGLTGLACGTTYHFQAFAINYLGMGTSTDSTFSTSDCSAVGGGGGGGGGSTSGSSRRNSVLTVGVSASSSSGVQIVPPTSTNQFPVQTIFARNLSSGSSGNDVKNLQKYLNSKGFAVAVIGPGSAGHETNVFGALTRIALVKFQKANKISPAVGFFGPLTRAFIANSR